MPLEPEFGQIAIVIPASVLLADTGVNGIEHCLLRIGGLDVLVLQVVKRDFGDLGNIAVMGRVETVELGDRELGTSHATRVFDAFARGMIGRFRSLSSAVRNSRSASDLPSRVSRAE
jgi:hypothetical protein